MAAALLAFALAQAISPDPANGISTSQGLFLRNGQPLQQVTATLVSYVGDCPGDGQDEIKGVSFLTPIPPAPYQRIVIRNNATGGYTDREYDERRSSAEPFTMALGSGHRGSALTLIEGANRFSYVVRNRSSDTELGQGSASLDVAVERVTRSRNFSRIEEKRYCLGDRSSAYSNLDSCPDGLITVERKGYCPSGSSRILTLETVRLRPR